MTAAHGAEALAIARSLPNLDLLFTDVVMPGMSGVDLAARMKTVRTVLPVIYASGFSDEAFELGGGGDGANHFLPKPYCAEELLARVREVLDRHSEPR